MENLKFNILRKTLITQNHGKQKIIDQKKYISFSDNDYLGLSHHADIKKAFLAGIDQFGTACAPVYLTGYTIAHQNFEKKLSEFLGTERTLLLTSTYLANIAALTALADKNTVLIHDRLNHKSLLDASLLSGASLVRYEHNNMKSLETALQRNHAKKIIIICDGVFSMNGDLAVLPEIINLKNKYQAMLMIDDAHGFAHIGEGKGTLAHYGYKSSEADLITATLSKGLGISGGFISGKEEIIAKIEQHGSSYVFSTSLLPAACSAGIAAIKLMQKEKWRFEKIALLTAYLKDKINNTRLKLISSSTAIQPLLLGSAEKTWSYSVFLYRRHIFIAPICFPVVPEGQGRLRITLTALHEKEDIDVFITALLEAEKELN